MIRLSLLKRRQLLLFGGGVISFLGGATTTKIADIHTGLTSPYSKGTLTQADKQPYLNPHGYDQHFLVKSAVDVKQIWDFVTIDQVQLQGLTAIRNALNTFQFVYRKTLYPVICLRGNAVIYAFDDKIWIKYDLGTLFGSKTIATHGNPLYSRQTTDNGELSPEDPNSLYQDSSLQALLQRGIHIAVCHDALNSLLTKLADKLLIQITSDELVAHLIPGAQQTPSGSSLIAVAQQFGFTYAKQ